MKRYVPIALAACLAFAALWPPLLDAGPGGTGTATERGWPGPVLAPKAVLRPKTWRALVEEAVLWSASTIDYWGAYGKFTVDWQFTWKTFGRKFFTAESPRMDSNAFWFNWSHAGTGSSTSANTTRNTGTSISSGSSSERPAPSIVAGGRPVDKRPC